MDHESFIHLYQKNSIIFLLAMELFLDKGRPALTEDGYKAWAAAVSQKILDLNKEQCLRTITDLAIFFSDMDAGNFLIYAKQCGYCFDGANREVPQIPDCPF